MDQGSAGIIGLGMKHRRHNYRTMQRNASPDEIFAEAYDAEIAALNSGKDTNVYMAVLLGCIAVLDTVGFPNVTWRDLTDSYHDPLVSFSSEKHVTLHQVGVALDHVWVRAGRRDAPYDADADRYRSRHEYPRAPDFRWIDDQITAQAKKLKIRRGTKKWVELLAGVKEKAIAGATDSAKEIAYARSIRIDGEIERVAKAAAAKRERVASVEWRAAIAMALIEAAGAGPSEGALAAMREATERVEGSARDLEAQVEYLESTKETEDPRAIAEEWWQRVYGASR